MDLAPIAFFAYKRPEHTLKALSSLSKCDLAKDSKLYVFCDGAKCAEDMESVLKVREVAKSQLWCGEVEIIEQEKNMGLARSIISGVTNLCQESGKVIVLEDDLLLHPCFLEYMNTGLNLYENEKQVMQIGGHMFPANFKPETDSIFLPYITSWGWATWERAWNYFDPNLSGYPELKNNRKLRYKFDLDGSYYYFSLLEGFMNGKVDSWAIVWYLSVFMQEGLTLFPVYSLVDNIGFDGSGIHCKQKNLPVARPPKGFRVRTYPNEIKESIYKKKVFRGYAKGQNHNLWTRLRRKLQVRTRLKKLLKR
ncbi:hypothetical protein [Roseofilum capinflatum]|uniref:Sugar transferase n=1 Tax=Roseofilum capinflatum BLCC-M114 TaxID=3022440 RepID=A0ABT7BA64_9CYAN|nr:hypothetical protein [Roseofilum capinflatum]MDJ1175489.1 hypothetical protein [Roseofilum capinflatum BLCC-M114]